MLTNDLERTAVEIAALYKSRWQIELLFRWIKQHLTIRRFLGNNDNAIRLQLFAAMIAYALLRIAARATASRCRPSASPISSRQFLFSAADHRRHRQASARQPKQPQIPNLPQSDEFSYD